MEERIGFREEDESVVYASKVLILIVMEERIGLSWNFSYIFCGGVLILIVMEERIG